MSAAEKAGQPEQGLGVKKPAFANRLFSTDSLTEGHAYINSIRVVPGQNDRELVFVSLGLQSGSVPAADGEGYEPVYQNVDVLCGVGLERSLKMLAGEYTKDTGKLYGRVQIRNLVFRAEPSERDERIFLNTRGILETLQFGSLEA